MRISRPVPIARRHSAKSAFTMIEIAMSLAIIGFALVAIIGILPMGIDVQKNNRRETIINQDANYFIEAIRNGARGLDDLTNYVIGITNYWTELDGNFVPTATPPGSDWYDRNGSSVTPTFALISGRRIVGILSTPKYAPSGGGNYHSNYVVAYFKALSGVAIEKFPQDNALINEAAFSYRLVPEIVPCGLRDNTYYDASWRNSTNRPVFDNLTNNLHDVRLLFRWPLLPGGKIGNGRQVYRLRVSGNLTNEPLNSPAWFFQPQIFVP
ncbi:MAG: type II secretion system protein [Verrucomicrobia bacterium]|nr:type II secretion system protein [Verrucomicrobiota bacterium]